MKYKTIKKSLNIINKKIVHIVKNGIKFSMIFCLLASFILVLYCGKANPEAFYVGISLLKSGMFFISMFIICGIVFDKKVN